MGLSSPGIGSGLDVNSLVSQLMSAESQPLTLLQKKEAKLQSQLSALGQVKSAVSNFQSALSGLTDVSKFQAVKATPADTSVLSASAGSSASPGSYSIEVTQLAQAQKLVSAGQASTTATIGTGTLTFDFGTISGGSFDAATGKYTGAAFTSSGGGAKTVTIDASNSSLSGIRDAINKAGIGVTASIVNDGSATPNRLVLTDTATGAVNSMKITVSGDAALSGLLSHDPANGTGQALQETVKAQNAVMKVDGLTVSKPSNHVSDMIEGVTLDLAKTNAGSPTTLSVARDTAGAASSVSAFVSAYNAVSKTLADSSSYNADTKAAAVLNGDSTVRNIQSRLRSMVSSSVAGSSGAYSRLSDIGVTFQKDGTLAVDSGKLNKALSSNFNDVAKLFGVAGSTSDVLVSYAGATDATKPGTYAVNVSRLATRASVAGTSAAGLTIDAGNDSLSIGLDGKSAVVKLPAKTYASASELAAEVQASINGNDAFEGAQVTVTASNGVLSVNSNRYGAQSAISVGGNGADNLLGAAPIATAGFDAAGIINGMAATGSGQKLIGANGSVAEGLAVQINGGLTGSRGTVSYSKGFASQLDDLVSAFLDSDGSLTAHTNGISKSIASLKKQEDAVSQRLTTKEAALRKQFTALDTQLSSMSTMSTYLSQQLAQISANSSSD